MQKEKAPVGIVGTGDFARGLAKRLCRSGYTVLCGSRFPETRVMTKRDPELATLDVTVLSIEQVLSQAEVIFIALHAEHVESAVCKHAPLLTSKVLVEVSNPKVVTSCSQAEKLQKCFPMARVVKAFNTVSSFQLENNTSMKETSVYIAGDNSQANDLVASLVREIGFTPMIRGGLIHARDLEAMQRDLLGNWKPALLICLPFFIFWFVYAVVRFHAKKNPWSQLPMHILNKVFGSCALTYLPLCFLPGCVASTFQLIRGTKYTAFPYWLDKWLKCRKQLGHASLFCAFVHCILSVAHLSPLYFTEWYDVQETIIPVNQTKDISVPIDTTMNWRGELAILLGVISFAILCMLGITSLPSVGATMNWRQWRFVQTYMGYTCLVLATTHVIMKGYYKWSVTPFIDTVQGMSFLSLIIAYITLVYRLILLLPPMSVYLYKIQRGWERGFKARQNDVQLGDTPANTTKL